MGIALVRLMESAPAEHAAANSRAKTLRTTKSGLAKRYQVGIRTIENWQYSGVIYARFEQGRAVFDVADCDERLLGQDKGKPCPHLNPNTR
jgi:hypothetical protein